MDYDYLKLKKKSEEEYNRWLDNTEADKDFHQELLEIYVNEEEIIDSFYTDLSFGTSGMRGILGPGTNRINGYTVRRATQGISNYLNKALKDAPEISVVISYDSRKDSEYLANETAAVFNGNGIKTYIFKQLTPVSVLSYSIKQLGCDMGIMITASHNPRIYNGYKVYNKDGYQIVGDVPNLILDEINQLDFFKGIKYKPGDGILTVPNDISLAFIHHVVSVMPNIDNETLNGLKTIYTPLNGAGALYVKEVFRNMGYSNYEVVKVQEYPDSEFTTCPIPNPERILSFDEAFKLMDSQGADIAVATDPDSDRAGAALYHDGMRTLLTGNQLGILMIDYLCHFKPPKKNQLVFKSIVSSPMVNMLAKKYGFKVVNTLTGFKYIGESITKLEEKGLKELYYYGFEESNSFLMDPFIAEKDGVSAVMLIVQMAAFHKSQGKDLIDRLNELYSELGMCADKIRNYYFRGPKGKQTMEEIMDFFRYKINNTLGDKAIIKKIDYKKQTVLPKSNVVEFILDDGSKVILRPSGTEAKLKVYSFDSGDFHSVEREIISIIEHFKD